jgi:hypothetical protein
MLSARQVAAIEKSAWFQAGWAPYALFDTDLRIRAVNTAHEWVSAQPRECMVGRPLFEVCPDNPAAPEVNGVANLSSSPEKTFRRGPQHWLGVPRYDLPDVRSPARSSTRCEGR